MYFFVYLESSRTLSRTLSTSGAVSSITNPSFQSTLQRAPRENPPSWVSVALRGRKKTVRESFQQRRSNASDSLKCLIFSYIFLSWSLFEMREELFRSYQGKYHKLFNEASLKQERPWYQTLPEEFTSFLLIIGHLWASFSHGGVLDVFDRWEKEEDIQMEFIFCWKILKI